MQYIQVLFTTLDYEWTHKICGKWAKCPLCQVRYTIKKELFKELKNFELA